MKARAVVVLVAEAALGLAAIMPAFAATTGADVGVSQGTPLRIQGRVEWISGQVMVIAPDRVMIAPGGTAAAINVDLSRVDQDEYQRVATGDAVLVTGIVPRDGDRVVATSVQPLPQ